MPWTALEKDTTLPVRIHTGTQGLRIPLETNFFHIVVANQDTLLVHYDVTVKKEKGDKKDVVLPRKVKMSIFEELKKTYSGVFKDQAFAFDSDRNAYSVGYIPEMENGYNFEVEHEGMSGMERFYVQLKMLGEAYLSDLLNSMKAHTTHTRLPTNAIQMLEVMFRHYRSIKYQLVGKRCFFSTTAEFGQSHSIGHTKEGVVGFFGSMRPAAWKDGSLLLNIDVSHTAFYREQPLLDYITSAIQINENDLQSPLPPHAYTKLKQEIVGLQVQSTHTNIPRVYRILDVSSKGSCRQQIPYKDEETGQTYYISLERYLRESYGKKLRYPNFNCLQLVPKEREVFLPVESLKMPKGQRVNKKLTDHETAQFIRTTAVPPAERRRQIVHIHHINDFTQDPMLNNLRFTIAEKPLNVDGRILPTPKLFMDSTVVPEKGVWDARHRKFFRAGSIHSWVVFNYASNWVKHEEIVHFVNSLMNLGLERGIQFVEPHDVFERPRPNPERDFNRIVQKYQQLDLIMVVLGKGDDLYARIKKTGDIDYGILTQCIQGRNVKSCKPSTLGNLILKINAKLDGINSIISPNNRDVVFDQPIMIMGADVNHPPPGDGESPSIAAVVSSVDRHATRFCTEVRTQEHRVEIIQEFKLMTKNLLMAFYKKNMKRKPQRIIMYRDGVSESQFQEVLAYEMMAMRNACSELEPSFEPGITFIVVQKRHHTRLFCNERQGVGKCLNIPPGTVVDSSITHPKERDFYLCSHQGIQGTSKPTHYHVLWDDNDFSMDQLQSLTYNMCHLYNRCLRAVSLPNAAYYAHLAAYRAKIHITNTDHDAEKPSKEEIKKSALVDFNKPISEKFYYV